MEKRPWEQRLVPRRAKPRGEGGQADHAGRKKAIDKLGHPMPSAAALHGAPLRLDRLRATASALRLQWAQTPVGGRLWEKRRRLAEIEAGPMHFRKQTFAQSSGAFLRQARS